MTSFPIGEQVILKSGGPLMTVDEIDDESGRVRCIWFDDKKQPQMRTFTAATLERYE